MRPRVFLDSGIFIAVLNRRDRHHDQAMALFAGETPHWFTSRLVWSETYSWFLHRHGEESARSFRRFADSLAGLTLLDSSGDNHASCCRLLDSMRGANLTYVDASSLSFMQEHGIETVWSTDFHLGITGAQIHPRD